MSFVYRYLDRAGDVRYIGMVKGDTLDCLARRINEHSREGFRSSWSIQYIGGLTRTDADLLESHLINSCLRPELLRNKAKTSFGKITIATIKPLHWRRASGALPTTRSALISSIDCLYYRFGHRIREFPELRSIHEQLSLLSKEQLSEALIKFEDAWDTVVKSQRRAGG